MMDKNPIRNIALVGSGLGVWLPAAFLAARFAGTECKLEVFIVEEPARKDFLLARPSVRRLHQVMHLTENSIISAAQARKITATPVLFNKPLPDQVPDGHEGDREQIGHLPFGQFGLDRNGADFFHYWNRARLSGGVQSLSSFNLSLVLAIKNKFLAKAPNGLPSLDYGYIFSRAGYTALMRNYALKSGVTEAGSFAGATLTADKTKIVSVTSVPDHKAVGSSGAGAKTFKCDMLFDMTDQGSIALNLVDTGNISRSNITPDPHKQVIGWKGNCLVRATPPALPGMEIHFLQSVVERFIALLPDCQFHACETAEYNRLAVAERQRVQDMADLLAGDRKLFKADLVRKCTVFQSRGRIVMEDYEVFTKHEWLAALTGCGIFPDHYDRMADRIPLDDIIKWLNDLHRATAAAAP